MFFHIPFQKMSLLIWQYISIALVCPYTLGEFIDKVGARDSGTIKASNMSLSCICLFNIPLCIVNLLHT